MIDLQAPVFALQINQLLTQSILDHFGSIVQVQFRHQARSVCIHRLVAHVQ
jgi:hypothetical protein